ncbi:MAG: plasmid pRiA4b ORF-3 family protein [Flavobacteriaceae bacterium]|nr:plasmid pRiA4b ORF-3 family protein [Flavobacteriaceae bacterium]
MAQKQIFQLKVTLMYFDPVIWRRIQVERDTTLPDLHDILQITMGWTDSHLHHFVHKRKIYGEDDPWTFDRINVYDDVKLDDLLKRSQSKLIYEYDFGDSWRHEILLEKMLSKDASGRYPVCIDGENACPPEDCGGVWGYERLLEIIKDPEHEEYHDWLEWLGEDFDPAAFDIEVVNECL